MATGHIERDKDYVITGIELCDLLSIAHDLEEAPHLPATQRRTLADQMRKILARAVLVGKRKGAGRAPK